MPNPHMKRTLDLHLARADLEQAQKMLQGAEEKLTEAQKQRDVWALEVEGAEWRVKELEKADA